LKRKLLCASLIVLFTASAFAQSPERESAAEANKAAVKRAFAAFNDGDLKTLNELFDPHGSWHLPNGKTMPQGGPFTELAKSCPMCAALEQRKVVIDVIVAESDLIAVRSTWSGLYTGTTRGVSIRSRSHLCTSISIASLVAAFVRTGLNTTVCRWPSSSGFRSRRRPILNNLEREALFRRYFPVDGHSGTILGLPSLPDLKDRHRWPSLIGRNRLFAWGGLSHEVLIEPDNRAPNRVNLVFAFHKPVTFIRIIVSIYYRAFFP
jgi:SnoaL-like domain